MSALFNQFSYLWIGLALTLALLVALRWRRVRWWRTLAAAGALAVVFGVGWLALRPGENDISEIQTAEKTLANGRPTFLEFFSNYCMGCIAARPVVDALVSDIQDRFNIMRVDIHTELGRALRQRYGFSYSPEFVLFDAAGQEVWRSNRPPSADQIALAVP
jgi:thiol-disulfide isomerase/thioredoxin